MWKAQVPYLARHHRVVVIDPRGNGLSDRPTDPPAYSDVEQVADVIAVMDELGLDRAVLVGLCMSAFYSLEAAAWHPERIAGVVAVATWAMEGTPRPDRGGNYLQAIEQWDKPYAGGPDWLVYNRDLWLRDWPRWPQFFFSEIVNDPHSTKLYEDLVGWACESSGPVQVAAHQTTCVAETPETVAALLADVRCPVLAIHGTHDYCQTFARGAHIARLAGGELLAMGGAGHVPPGRDPVAVNHAIADFVARVGTGTVHRRTTSPVEVRAQLSSRRDPATPGVAIGPDGSGAPAVVVLRARGADAPAWERQLPALARHVSYVVGDDPVAEIPAVGEPVVVVAPPGRADDVVPVLGDTDRVAAVLLVEAPRALAEQPGLLEFFFDRLPHVMAPSAIVRGLVDADAAGDAGRVPVVAVVDDRTQVLTVPVDAVVTVEGGVPTPRAPRPAPRRRDRRVLFLSSPIGLGHVRRDLAIADALRRQHPDLQVDWLSQSPVTEFLAQRGEHVHPASAWLSAESGHIESEAGEHDLHAFQAIRRMDEILVNNFHVFDELVQSGSTTPGSVTRPGTSTTSCTRTRGSSGRRSSGSPTSWAGCRCRTAVSTRRRWRLTTTRRWWSTWRASRACATARSSSATRRTSSRSRSVPGCRGPRVDRGALRIQRVRHGRPARPAERERLRGRLGYRDDETVCVVSVGGSAVGGALLQRVVDAFGASRARVPSLRMLVVTGPRLDPASITAGDGVKVRGFVPDLDLHHAACDVAVVQGGLSTTMELAAAGRPFLYFPLRHHFEQQIHVRHRLDRHDAGRAMDYETADPGHHRRGARR